MKETKVGFITPKNEIFHMNYDEVNDFCKLICEREENKSEFDKFSKDYTYFYPYFDFVMFKLDYIFINPLLEEETYLKKVGNALYKIPKNIIDDNKNIYEYITSLAKRIKNGGNYPWLVACSDKELNIKECNIENIHKCMIDPNGFCMISTNDGEKEGNHEITSSTIVNQLLITSKSLWRNYEPNEYTATYLIEKFGFIRSDSIEYGGNMIGLEKFLTDKVKKFKNLCVEEKGCIFYDWEKIMTEINQNKETYEIKRR